MLGALTGELRWLDLDERPGEVRGDPLRERRLAGAGRAEEDDGPWRRNGMASSKRRLGQGQNDPSLDDLLGFVQALHLVPEAGLDHPAKHVGEATRHRAHRGDRALEVHGAADAAEVTAFEILTRR